MADDHTIETTSSVMIPVNDYDAAVVRDFCIWLESNGYEIVAPRPVKRGWLGRSFTYDKVSTTVLVRRFRRAGDAKHKA